MRIGIITFWDSDDNYGQLFQSYALQAFLRQHGHDAFVIRYKQSVSKKISVKKFNPGYIISYLKYRKQLKSNRNVEIIRDFAHFRKSINYSAEIYHGFSELVKHDWSDVDAFVCGSDQIWSPRTDDEIKSYFLRFTPFQKKRIAYAPSFGREQLDDNYQKRLHDLLRNFDSISVREKSGQCIAESAGYNAELVCDPTLLLQASHYKERFVSQNLPFSPGAFLYFINWETDADFASIDKYLTSRGLVPHLFSTDGFESPWRLDKIQSPENWLSVLAHSKISIVNSFHGLVFSVIMRIPFAVCLLKGAQGAMNGRIISLLDLLDLKNRIISETNTVDSIFDTEIDWAVVDQKLSSFIKSSADYLLTALKEDNPAKDKHNICFLSSGCIHHFYGGLDRVTEILADRFENDGHSVYYLSWRNRGKYNPVRQTFFPDKEKLKSETNSKFLSDFVVKNNIDIIINQEANVNFCIPFKGRENLVVISCLHFNPDYIDNRHFQFKFSKSRWPVKIIMKALFSFNMIKNTALSCLRKKLGNNYRNNLDYCDKLVLLSPRFNRIMVDLLEDHSNIEKIEYIPNPNSIISLPEVNLEKTKTRQIVYAGRMDNNFKRVNELLDAVGGILEKYPEWTFVLCGDGPDKDELEAQARRISDRIIFTGYCDPTSYYKSAEIIVLRSSSSEGWGMVLVEAMSYGVVPVVAGTYASLPDIIESGVNGIITDDDDESFITALTNLMDNCELRRHMAQEAVEKARSFSVDNVIKHWYKLFDRCFSH